MTTSDKYGPALQPSELFAGLTQAQLVETIAASLPRRVGARAIIQREGQPATHLFILTSGRAKFYRVSRSGEEVLLSQLLPGDVFGLGTLLAGPVSYIGTAETVHESELLVWEQAQIRELARKYPRLAENALGIVLRYLAAHLDRLFDLVACSSAERLARVWFTSASGSANWLRPESKSPPLTKSSPPWPISARLR
jgi:CRP-like cAMP-binding protein